VDDFTFLKFTYPFISQNGGVTDTLWKQKSPPQADGSVASLREEPHETHFKAERVGESW
jgi:hypothetical protein